MIYIAIAWALKQYTLLEIFISPKETLNGKTELTPPAGNITEQAGDNTFG